MSALTPPASSSVVPTAPSITSPQLQLKHSIKAHVKYHGILRGIADKLVSEIPDISGCRLSPELTNLVCTTVENIIVKGNVNQIDKKQLVIDVLDKTFNLTEDEKNQLNMQIDFLFDNGNIKKLSSWLSVFRKTSSIFASKVL